MSLNSPQAREEEMKHLAYQVQVVKDQSAGEMSRKENWEFFVKNFSQFERKELAEVIVYLMNDEDLTGLASQIQNARRVNEARRNR